MIALRGNYKAKTAATSIYHPMIRGFPGKASSSINFSGSRANFKGTLPRSFIQGVGIIAAYSGPQQHDGWAQGGVDRLTATPIRFPGWVSFFAPAASLGAARSFVRAVTSCCRRRVPDQNSGTDASDRSSRTTP
jgi:hypothetical protein